MAPTSTPNPEQLLELSQEVSRIAATLANMSTDSIISVSDEVSADAELAHVEPDLVRKIIEMRVRRVHYLPPNLFSDPAWDILLELLYFELTNRRISVTSLCLASRVPATTALRWINGMVEQGLLVRRDDRYDGRRVYIELSKTVSRAVRRYFAEVIQRSFA